MIDRFEPGARCCTAVTYAGLMWISGVVGWNNQHGTVEAQVEEVFGRLDHALTLAGPGLSVEMAAVAALGAPLPVSRLPEIT